MKKRFIFAILLCLTILMTACAPANEPLTDDLADPQAAYEARIAELEAQLVKQQEEKFISDVAFKARIAELEGQLLLLAPDKESGVGDGASDAEMIFTYRVENGKAILTGYEGRSNLVTIPTTLDGYPVVAIGERAFEGKNLAAVTLPDGLEAVGWFAFYGCTGLMDVTVPASVTSIGYAVFDGCERITIIGRAESYAAQYAKSYGLPFVAI